MRTPDAPPTYNGSPLDTSPDAFGALRRSDPGAEDVGELRHRLEDDGYLYLPGFLERDRVSEVRRDIFERLAAQGVLDPTTPPYEGVCRPDLEPAHRPALDYRPDGTNESVADCAPLRELAYGGRMMALWDALLGGEAQCLEYVWFRAKGPGQSRATPPHCDAPYMARGTHRLYIAWVPYVDIGLDMGGLMLLEGSHRNSRVLEYCRRDVDVYCKDAEDAPLIESGEKTFQRNGAWSLDAITARAELGGRWLTTEYRMGDVLIFGIFTMHATCDNQTSRMRISSDTRYQLASDPVDDRWAGPDPIRHGPAAKRAAIY
jgi:hypothetical protein